MRKAKPRLARSREQILDEGEQSFYEGNYEVALGRFEEVIALESDDAEAHYLRARSLFYVGRDEEAEEAYDRALDLAPDFAPALIHKAELFVRAFGWCDDALDLLDEAESFTLHRDDKIEASFVRGLAQLERAEYRLALEPLNRAVRGDAEWSEALRERGICRFYLWRFEDAVRDLERAAARDPGDAEAHYLLAMALERLGRDAAATRAYEKAATIDPHSFHSPLRTSKDDFERIVSHALEDLPEDFRVRFDHLKVVVEPLPERELGVAPDAFGCSMPASGDDASVHAMLRPCVVVMFQRNLERACADPRSLRDEIAKTVLHEVGRYFGLGDDDVVHFSVH